MPDRESGPVLVDVLDRVLDKGIVIDAAVRVSVAGIELLGVDARVVVASIETYLLHSDTLAHTDMAAAPPRVIGDSPPLEIADTAPPLAISDSTQHPPVADAARPLGIADGEPPPPSVLYAEETDAAEPAPDRVMPPAPPIVELPEGEGGRPASDGPEPVEEG